MSTLAPFNDHCVRPMQDDIGDGCIVNSMTFQESSDKDYIDGNNE